MAIQAIRNFRDKIKEKHPNKYKTVAGLAAGVVLANSSGCDLDDDSKGSGAVVNDLNNRDTAPMEQVVDNSPTSDMGL